MNKQFSLLYIFIVAFMLGNIDVVQAKTSEEPFAVMTAIKLNDETVDDAIELLSELQLSTIEHEDGCMIFDVLLGEDDPTDVFVYESYVNEAAYDKHLKSKHHTDIFNKKLKPLIKELKTTKVFLLNYDGGYSDEDI